MLKVIKASVLMSIVVLANTAWADATLLVGENTVVMKIDGQEVNGGFFSADAKKFTLPAGIHVFEARYERLYEFRNDDHDNLKSNNVSLNYALADGEVYTLDMINQPEKYEQASKYVEQPTLGIMKNGSVLAQQSAIVGAGGGLLASLSNVFSAKKPEPTAVKINTTAVSSAINSPQNKTSQAVVPSNNRLDQFMSLWLKATPTERNKIRDWVTTQ